MPLFRYTAKDREHRTVSGEITAKDRLHAVREIERTVGVPVRVDIAPPPALGDRGPPPQPSANDRLRANGDSHQETPGDRQREGRGAGAGERAVRGKRQAGRVAMWIAAAAALLAFSHAFRARSPIGFGGRRLDEPGRAPPAALNGSRRGVPVGPEDAATGPAEVAESGKHASPGVTVRVLPQPARTAAVSGSAAAAIAATSSLAADGTRPRENADSMVEKIARDLAKTAVTDSQKAAAIYYWVTHYISYDHAALAAGYHGAQSPESVIAKGKALCAGYTALFAALGRAMGLDARVVTGRTVGPLGGNDKGLALFERHAWNAARVDGAWRLFDPTWGAADAPVEKNRLSDRQEYYFETPPQRLIYDHFPDESAWQLLGKPVSWAEFMRLPRLKPSFFLRGLDLVSPRTSFFSAGENGTAVLRVPDDVELNVGLAREGGEWIRDGATVSRSASECRIEARPPEPGLYLLTVWCRRAAGGGRFEPAVEFAVEKKD